MRPEQVLDRRSDLLIAAALLLGLGLAIAAAAAGLRWLSADWNTLCHRLLHAPSAPSFSPPWRLADLRPETRCPRLRP